MKSKSIKVYSRSVLSYHSPSRFRTGELESDYEESYSRWLITFSDLLLLLLAGFVIQLAMVSLTNDMLASGLGITLEKRVAVQEATISLAKDLKKIFIAQLGDPRVVEGKEPILLFPEEVQLTVKERGLSVTLGGGLFLPGKRHLSEQTRTLILRMVPSLIQSKVAIKVEGHTDDTPISTAEFPSNWELSAARAIEVAQVLLEQGVEGQRVSAVGYSDSRPIADNESDVGRAANRRVELFLEPILGE